MQYILEQRTSPDRGGSELPSSPIMDCLYCPNRQHVRQTRRPSLHDCRLDHRGRYALQGSGKASEHTHATAPECRIYCNGRNRNDRQRRAVREAPCRGMGLHDWHSLPIVFSPDARGFSTLLAPRTQSGTYQRHARKLPYASGEQQQHEDCEKLHHRGLLSLTREPCLSRACILSP